MPCPELRELQDELQQLEDSEKELRWRCQDDAAANNPNSPICLSWRDTRDKIDDARDRLAACLRVTTIETKSIEGRVSLLLAHVAGGWGPTDDHLASDVVFKLTTMDDLTFGFFVGTGNWDFRLQHGYMYELLLMAVQTEFPVKVDYHQIGNRKNVEAVRIHLLPQIPEFELPNAPALEAQPISVPN